MESGPAPKSAQGRLTERGVRQLFWNSEESDVRLQVLGVYRYLVDPALKQRLGGAFEAERDVFDVLLSDGRHKMKAVLVPALNKLVWKREMAVRSIISVKKFEVYNEDPEDEQRTHRVCVLQDIQVMLPSNEEEELPQKLLYRRYGAKDDELDFVSTVHPREVELIPLVGGRLYYLPLRSDHYALDWACSFTDGSPEEESPIDELEINWASRFGAIAADQSGGLHSRRNLEMASCTLAWNSSPNNCSDLFTPEYKKIFKTLEALEAIKRNKQAESNGKPHPPIVGAIRVKSKVMHVGDPNISNPFPFVFNAIVVDVTGVIEVAFYGSMCAKYFLSLQEGDLVQLRGYLAVAPTEIGFTSSTSPVLYYEHESSGCVLHVPKRYWKLLEMANVAPPSLEARVNLPPAQSRESGCIEHRGRPSWLECGFVNTLGTLYWGKSTMTDADTMYFDFVGVLSNVGKIFRERKRKLREDSRATELTESRWVKTIDSSSSYELVIRVDECSQPAIFRSLKAGDSFMATKLQWMMLPGSDVPAHDKIQYAASSVFSVLRSNEAIRPFFSLEECKLNDFFAKTIMKDAIVDTNTSTGESKLASHIEKKYCPRNRLPTNVHQFMEAFSLEVLSFSDMTELLEQMEALEYRRVGFIGRVCKVSTKDNKSELFLDLCESHDTGATLTVQTVNHPLYQKIVVKGSVKAKVPPKSLPLIRLLPPDLVEEMYAQALEESHLGTTLTLPFIEQYLTSDNKDFFFSLHLYRDALRMVTWEVDAILVPSP